jgi:hypothetical protein
MNVLYRPEIFLPSTALIVVILLVWAQLTKWGQDRGEFTLYLGFFWIYLAIFFALIAFGLHVLECKRYAIGFLGLAFLMAVVHVFYSTLRILLLLKRYTPGALVEEKALVQADSRCKKWSLLLAMAVAVVGLALVSFSLAYRCLLTFWWTWLLIGGIFVAITTVYILLIIIKSNRNNDRPKRSYSPIGMLVVGLISIFAVINLFYKLFRKK